VAENVRGYELDEGSGKLNDGKAGCGCSFGESLISA
jgi:hypothetical protein